MVDLICHAPCVGLMEMILSALPTVSCPRAQAEGWPTKAVEVKWIFARFVICSVFNLMILYFR